MKKNILEQSVVLALMTVASTISGAYSRDMERKRKILGAGLLKGLSLISGALTLLPASKMLWTKISGD